MVSQGDFENTLATGRLSQEFVATLSRSHFDREPGTGGQGFGIGLSGFKREAQSSSGPPDKPFVCNGFRTAEAMIEMRHHQGPAVKGGEGVEHMQKNHRIDATGNGDEKALVRSEEALLLDGEIDLQSQVAHGVKRKTKSIKDEG
jgi:hypothetical protein